MYALYKKTATTSGFLYEVIREVSLFGCNSGELIKILRSNIKPNDSERLEWHLDLDDLLYAKQNHVLMINLKPNSKGHNLSLYEIANVWGVSDSGWSPIMLHIRGLIIDDVTQSIDQNIFERNSSQIDDPIFSMLYLDGTVKSGELTGKWTAPRPSPTNSCLLWPDTFDYFDKARRSITNC